MYACLLHELVIMRNALIVVDFVIDCVCELIVDIHCACENSIGVNNVAEWYDFFCSCL